MTSIEETGRNIEEATQRALEQLGVTEDEVDVEILEEGARGFLGLGQAPAKVRVTLKEVPAGTKPRNARSTSAGAASGPGKASEAATKEAPVSTIEREPVSEPVAEIAPSEAAETSRDMLQHILDGIGIGGTANVKGVTDGVVALDIVGGDASVLIGKHGQTIDAIQYLLGVIASKRLSSKVRVVVDTEGYRTRREEALKNQALYLATKVKQTGQEAVLDALHANERRIIHTALANDPEVYTYSEGVEPDRHVVISPRKS